MKLSDTKNIKEEKLSKVDKNELKKSIKEKLKNKEVEK